MSDETKPCQMEEREVLEIELRVMQATHRSLDIEITGLEAASSPNALLIQRLKRRKLALKDQINRIENRLFPDIIA